MARQYSFASYIFCILVTTYSLERLKAERNLLERKNGAFFIFGDSSVDAGNNNYIHTIPENQANYKPYGQNGFFEVPTGRFSDGRIIVDYIAEYAYLPLIPPYLHPHDDYTNGVNFASGGAGILPETNQGMVIDLPMQLKKFEQVISLMKATLGEAETENLIAEAVYFISMGSNDYMGGFLANPKMQEQYAPEEFVGMVIGNLTQAIQVLYEKGGRKFAFLSLGSLGCLPAMRALNLNSKTNEGGCLEAASALAQTHNKALKGVLTSLEHILKGFKYCNSNFYEWLDDRMSNPSKYGFKEGIKACCGTGPYGGLFTCGGTKSNTQFQVCANSDDHVWWDSFHPTERIHEQFAKAIWDGPKDSVGPYNLEDLFFEKEKLIIADIIDSPEAQHFQ